MPVAGDRKEERERDKIRNNNLSENNSIIKNMKAKEGSQQIKKKNDPTPGQIGYYLQRPSFILRQSVLKWLYDGGNIMNNKFHAI